MGRVAIFIDGGYWHKILRNHFGNPQVDFTKLPIELAEGQEILRTYFYDCLPYQDNPPTEVQKRFSSSRNRFITALKFIPRYEVKLGKLVRREIHFVPLENTESGQGYRLATLEEIDAGVTSSLTKYEQKGVDVLLGTDLVKLAAKQSISTAILIAGDHDFVAPVKSAKEEGVLVKLFYRPGTVSSELLTLSDEKIEITRDLIDTIRK